MNPSAILATLGTTLRIAAFVATTFFLGCSSVNHSSSEKFDPLQEDYEMTSVKLAMRAKGSSKPGVVTPTVGSGDMLRVAMVGNPDSATDCVVLPDGLIYYDLAGGVPVRGLTASAIEKRLNEKLAATGEYIDPKVTVDIGAVQSRKFTILGQVGTPGSYSLRSPVRLLDAVADAGGVTGEADLGRSMVVRGNRTVPADLSALVEDGDMSQNIYLQSGDYVYIPLEGTERVHILGSVNRPTSVPFTDRLSVVSALAAAGGPSYDASEGKVAIVRGSLQTPRVAVIDFKDVIKGKASNFRLQPDDIIWVPRSPLALVEDYAALAMRSAASALAIRAADETIGDGAGSTGTSVNVQ